MVYLSTSSAQVTLRFFSPSHTTLSVRRLEVNKKLGEAIDRRADPKWPKEYSILHVIMFNDKSYRKEGRRWDIWRYSICLPKLLFCVRKPFSPGDGCVCLPMRSSKLNPWFPLLLLYLLICLYLNVWVFSLLPLQFSFPHQWGLVSKRLCVV